ncbi:hypothetical protein KO353_06615 [Elioraea tepida]|uniref:Uncharacterized protein n=1 Tax=Elioraea tepida TaxID=2843330 RepID=A0A975YKV0_9PROT|nr:hypothetical protein KO353_06615 [Elioraea tepida]
MSVMRFAGLALQEAVPDAETIWLSREQLTRSGALAGLFARFDAMPAGRGVLAMGASKANGQQMTAAGGVLTPAASRRRRSAGAPCRGLTRPGFPPRSRSRRADRPSTCRGRRRSSA